jgi:hypothetical protein
MILSAGSLTGTSHREVFGEKAAGTMAIMFKKIKKDVKKRFPRMWGFLSRIYAGGRRYCLKAYYFFKMRSKGCFLFQNKRMPYFGYAYNNADANERTVEVPIIYNIVKRYRPGGILEVGNVLSHYYNRRWDVVDKFEKGDNVINEDILRFKPGRKYSLVVSISTFEHIGYDERDFRDFSEGQDRGKVLEAIDNVINDCLSPGGLFVITIPFGHNAFLDGKILNGDIALKHIYYLKRISERNEWIQCGKEDVIGVRYDQPFKYANAIAVCATNDLCYDHPA